MTQNQIQLLSQAKKLITAGARKFEQRKDRDYLEDLLNLGIIEEEAWKEILQLNKHFWFEDPKHFYEKSDKTLLFKKRINGKVAYIKLKIEEKDGITLVVCLSFHEDFK